MSKRLAWLLGMASLVSIALLVACGSKYNSSSDGLVLVGSQGSSLIQSFSFSLGNGHIAAISNPPATSGVPSSMVVDPTGAFAYVLINESGSYSISSFKTNSNGTVTAGTSGTNFNQGTVLVQGSMTPESVTVVPFRLKMDAAGKFLFVANRATTDSNGLFVPGSVSVFSIGSGGALTEVTGSPFFTSNPATTTPQSSLDIVSVAPTPTVFPGLGLNGVQAAVCSGQNIPAPTSQYLYAVDAIGNQVFQFQVDTSSGALSAPTGLSAVPSFATGPVPADAAVDACNRFVFVSDSLSNQVSSYTICTVVSSACPIANGRLLDASGSPFSLTNGANGAGPLVVDPFGNYVYVVGTKSNTVSGLHISSASGGLTPLTTATVPTGSQPVAIAIRADDNWLFVANFNSASLSQYSITPASGALSVLPAVTTDNLPLSVAVK